MLSKTSVSSLLSRTAVARRRMVAAAAPSTTPLVAGTTTSSESVTRQALTSSTRSFSSSETPASFGHDKMETDKRYQGTAEVPESLLNMTQDGKNNQFSIRGEFREGRAAYLDMSATTPLDPRVLDVMLPYMVS